MVVVQEVATPINVSPPRGNRSSDAEMQATCRLEFQGTSSSRVSSGTRSQPASCSRSPSASPRSHTSWVSGHSPRAAHTPLAVSSAANAGSFDYGRREEQPDNVSKESIRHDVEFLFNALQRLETFGSDVSQLRRAQEQLCRKHEDAEVFRRGQIESVSDRIFQVERKLRKAEEDQREAIEKANLTFQKHFEEAHSDRHNLMTAIMQVNQNFERVSVDMGEQRASMVASQQGICQLQQGFEWLSADVQSKGASLTAMQQSLSALESSLQSQSGQVQELQVSTQALRDTMMQTTPQSSFAEAEERYRRLADNFAEVHCRVASLAEQMAKVDAGILGTIAPSSSAPQEVPVQVMARAASARSDLVQAAAEAESSSTSVAPGGNVRQQLPARTSILDTPPPDYVESSSLDRGDSSPVSNPTSSYSGMGPSPQRALSAGVRAGTISLSAELPRGECAAVSTPSGGTIALSAEISRGEGAALSTPSGGVGFPCSVQQRKDTPTRASTPVPARAPVVTHNAGATISGPSATPTPRRRSIGRHVLSGSLRVASPAFDRLQWQYGATQSGSWTMQQPSHPPPAVAFLQPAAPLGAAHPYGSGGATGPPLTPTHQVGPTRARSLSASMPGGFAAC